MKDLGNVALVNMAGNGTNALLRSTKVLNVSVRIAHVSYGLNCAPLKFVS